MTALGAAVCEGVMSEFMALAAVGGAIAAGVTFGTRYVNELFRVEKVELSPDQPIIRPMHLFGKDWKEAP
jgi:hypothetical protein